MNISFWSRVNLCKHGVVATCSRSLLQPALPALNRRHHTPRHQSARWSGSITRGVRHTAAALDLSLLDLDIPEIDGDLRSVQQELGATFDDDGVALTFNNTVEVLDALREGVVLSDQSHWGRLRLTGDDRLALMHNQSTNDCKAMAPGQGCDTVFVTSTGRCLDLATMLVGENNVLLLVSPSMREALLQRLDKYIFPADKVQVQDVSSRCVTLSMTGPKAGDVLQALCGDALTVRGAKYGSHQLLAFSASKAPVVVMAGSGLSTGGFTLVADESVAGQLYSTLIDKGCVPMGQNEWDIVRVLAGRPAVGAELTEEFNPLEAGLYHAVSVNKGCYIGQETLSKLHVNNGVKQQLWGLRLGAPAAAGTDILCNGERVGRVTSTAVLPAIAETEAPQAIALGYVRSRLKGAQVALEGISVTVDGVPATIVPIPYATRTFANESATSSSSSDAVNADGSLSERAVEARRQKEAAAAAEAAAKADRLQAMQARLAEWQAQQLAAQQAKVKDG